MDRKVLKFESRVESSERKEFIKHFWQKMK